MGTASNFSGLEELEEEVVKWEGTEEEEEVVKWEETEEEEEEGRVQEACLSASEL